MPIRRASSEFPPTDIPWRSEQEAARSIPQWWPDDHLPNENHLNCLSERSSAGQSNEVQG
jgi:hypothetical protein